ncbi:hypothetical protein [Streptomyces sp. TR06-5]|uniref:hypothetical protein n=1 Tax=unclassified Streptomyces TaxID=2593676 RepID=UPI0039A0E689
MPVRRSLTTLFAPVPTGTLAGRAGRAETAAEDRRRPVGDPHDTHRPGAAS